MAESFFLDPDEAKSLGNTEYMRTPKKVKKSFPSTKAWGAGFETEEEVSAMTKKTGADREPMKVEEVKVSEQDQKIVQQRRKADSSMDMFRNMAKDLRK